MAAITSAVIAVGTAGYQIYNAEDKKRKAKNAIKNFNSQDPVNPYSEIGIDTTKVDNLTETNLSNFATATEALRESGSRGVFSGIPRLSESNLLIQEAITSDIERQRRERDMLFAKGEEKIQDIRENREQLALQGLGQYYQTARQDSASGVTNLVSGLLSLGSAIGTQTGDSSSDGGLFSNSFGSDKIDTTIQVPKINTTKLF